MTKTIRVYLPWLRASVLISPGDIEDPSKSWIETADNWQRRALAAEARLEALKKET